MTANTNAELFRKYFSCAALSHYLRNIWPFNFGSLRGVLQRTTNRRKRQKAGQDGLQKAISYVTERCLDLGIDRAASEASLSAEMAWRHEERETAGPLEKLVDPHCRTLRESIAKIPNTTDKALDSLRGLTRANAWTDSNQVLDAMVLLKDEIPPEMVEEVVKNWKNEQRRHDQSWADSGSVVTSLVFWTSWDFHEDIDSLSRYRFREHFNIAEFEPVFSEIEDGIGTSMLESAGNIEPKAGPFPVLTSSAPHIAFHLFLMGRSRNLPHKLRESLDILLRRVATWQSPEGYWSGRVFEEAKARKGKKRIQPKSVLDVYVTALWSLNFLKLGIEDSIREKGIRGARWLLEQQNPDGSWSYPKQKTIRDYYLEADLFVTLLCLETIHRSGLEHTKRALDRGTRWIMTQQDELGMWEDGSFPFPFLTVLTLEWLQRQILSTVGITPFLSIAKGFISRSIQFSLEQNSNSHRLAVLTAYEGLEALLYAILSDPNVNIKIYEKPDETIGFRKALTSFQEYLVRQKKLKPGEVIPYRNSLDILAYLRDEVVHKGLDITKEMCKPLVEDAHRFGSKYSKQVLGEDLWA